MGQALETKLLLGWMSQHEAVHVLTSCVSDTSYTKKEAIALWRHYTEKVRELPPRNMLAPDPIDQTEGEKAVVELHCKTLRAGPKGPFLSSVAKVTPENLIVRQYYVFTERTEQYAQEMQDEQSRINRFLGIGMEFKGTLPEPRRLGKLLKVDLPHPEFVPIALPNGFTFQERDRYVTGAHLDGGRMILWCGYHRTLAVELLRQAKSEAAGAAALLTVMTGMPDVQAFFASRTAAHDCVLGERPALLQDFLNSDLCVTVNLRKTRGQGRIEQYCPTKMRAGVVRVPDES